MPSYGGIAQLGERLNGIQEVSGSIPLISTKVSDGTLRKVLNSTEFRTFSFLLRVRFYVNSWGRAKIEKEQIVSEHGLRHNFYVLQKRILFRKLLKLRIP